MRTRFRAPLEAREYNPALPVTEESSCHAQAPAAPAWQSVGLPGSEGWMSRMTEQGPEKRGEVAQSLQRPIGNQGFMGSIKAVAGGLLKAALHIGLKGSVGKGGKNDPGDVAAIPQRLPPLGYPPMGEGVDGLAAAIKR